ncbi:hypothetical protein ABTZ03_36410 [Kitasatospora sp. NPDC096077]|uniref:hypothetical protein n=1 Tax=Kitasatospora sp. NPDC096077 TaxID=3155544 RepID=UPI00331FC552
MRWIRRAARAADSDLAHALLFAGLTLAFDGWLLSHLRYDGRAAGVLAGLASVGAGLGLGLGLVGARLDVRHRNTPTPPLQTALRLARCAMTGALFIHLLLPAAVAADLVLHPDHLVGYLGGTLDTDH